jgi:hypothetical protein
MPRPNADILAMIVSDLIFRVTGFGPSKSICLPFAQQVLDEAEAVKYDIVFNLP